MLNPVRSHLRSGCAAASFVRLAKHRAHRRWAAQIRWQSSAAAVAVDQKQDFPETLAVPSTSRKNDLGVQQLSEHIYKQLFPRGGEPPPKELVKLAKDHLGRHELLGKTTDITDPIAFDLPGLQAPQTQTLDEHFHRLGIDAAEPFLSRAKEFAQASLPTLPRAWVRRSGWTKYYHQDGVGPIITEKIEAPDETMLSFDVEVMWKANPFAVMACAASPTAWYVWLSPWLLGEEENERQLVSLGDPTKDRVIVGHNIGYDRARILEEYDLKQTRNCFLDTMSLHVAVNGMCSQQRPTWMKHKKNRELREKIARETDSVELATMLADESLSNDEEELWVGRSSINSLRDVAKFHLNIAMDKSVRDNFGELNREEILERLDELITYCAKDVEITHKVYSIVFPNFLETCPHPVSFAALRHLSSVILPVNETWESYISEAEKKYQELSRAVEERLVALTNEALKVKDDQEKWSSDPWLRQLDWSGQEIKYTKGTKTEPPRIMKNQKMPGMPKWYKDLFPKKDAPINISVRTRVAPLLLKLSWSGHPLFWSDQYGWTFRVPLEEKNTYAAKAMKQCDMKEEKITMLRDDTEGAYFKVPHKDGPLARCANPLAKSYLNYFENGVLTSQYPYAKEALEMNASCSYWISARERIRSQLVVYEKELQVAKGQEETVTTLGYILPQIIPMGTVTRRAVENTWLTASNAKKTRVGSELKAMVKAPPGYSFVGADVDSEELWIASVLGDAVFKIHGGNAIGFMTLEGSKAAGTDLHSRTASILGISRNNAKVFNYGRIYGAGLKFAAQLLRQFNPALSDKETLKTALQLYAATKGQQSERRALYKRKFWRGGTESFVFNKLEEFAEQRQPRTPVLGAGITEALMSSYVSKGGFLTSRINWAIQSSGVDYLHLLIVAMDYLIRRFNIHARLAITVHDEIRYLVKNEDNYRAAMALQVANIWTRCMFAQQIGIDDLPQSCAFFSAVDIDHVLRKEVDMPCVTPSHKTPIPPGESIDIQQLLAKGQEAFLDESTIPGKYPPKLDDIPYKPRVPVMKELIEQDASTTDLAFIKAQITADLKELIEICAEKRRMINEQVEKQPTPRVKQRILPYNSEPELLPVDEPFMVSDAFRADQSKRAGGYYRRPDWERTTTQWTRSTVASKGTAH
ncbi:DNA polymerase gamma, mitochondrial [Cytospora mali]|uniref:DNA-directed DNA polymerase n=1 Tax=Cytospora mali TaxID=578113 RepID=A0A194UZC3_CYTMA|nr:DNA polymerase gamma, mitochondrial [Valsa mali var. pyri (nom. inval.)]